MSYEAQLHAEGKCAELVPVATEDGIVDGRCMRPIDPTVRTYRTSYTREIRQETLPMCEGHADEYVGWGYLTEAEKAQWEKRLDQEGR